MAILELTERVIYLNREYRENFVEGYNLAKEHYFELELERAKRTKEINEVEQDLISELRNPTTSISIRT